MKLEIHSLILVLAASGALMHPGSAKPVPAQLPDPDGQAGDASKRVKVYLLAGQSNMVGMGNLSGAKNRYAGMFLTADPDAPLGPLYVGRSLYQIAPYELHLPDGTKTDKPIAEGTFEVPQSGAYRLHAGFGDSSYNVMTVAGKEVYRRDRGGAAKVQDVTLEKGKGHAFKISGFKGEPPRFWMEKTDLLGYGDLEVVTKREGKFPYLVDDEGEWTVRKDVWFQEARIAEEGKGSPLSPTSNGVAIGPELGFGHVMGTFHDEEVLLIKTAMGNRALGWDFRPPSSGRTDTEGADKWEGLEYRLMVEGVRKTLENIARIVPGYQGQGYEIAGFAWWQGHKDGLMEGLGAEYEKNLVNLIEDVRREFKVPKMPAVVATVGFGGLNMSEKYVQILEAQMAVGDPKRHPEFAGNVASVDIRDFWREVDESPVSQDYHYNRNAETYVLVGEALGRAMVKLLGGTVEPSPEMVASAARPKTKTVPQAAPAEPTPDEIAKAQRALRPVLVDGLIPPFVETNRAALVAEAQMVKLKRVTPFLRGRIDELSAIYRMAGIDDYDWHSFGPDLRNAEWEYFSFDPPETLPTDSGKPRYRKVSFPEGMAQWFEPGFDAAKAGWKRGLPPFGQLGGRLEPLSETCTQAICGCGTAPKTLWDKEVLLLRNTFELPPLKEGHRYRIVVGGSAHVNGGEGYAISLNGKQLIEHPNGVGKRQGGQPRGAFLDAETVKELRGGGKVTIAATSFLRYHHPRIKPYPPRGHISLWLEEMKSPPLADH